MIFVFNVFLMGISMGKWPDFEYHGGKWLKYDRSGFNSSHPSLGSPLDLGNPWRPLATLGDMLENYQFPPKTKRNSNFEVKRNNLAIGHPIRCLYYILWYNYKSRNKHCWLFSSFPPPFLHLPKKTRTRMQIRRFLLSDNEWMNELTRNAKTGQDGFWPFCERNNSIWPPAGCDNPNPASPAIKHLGGMPTDCRSGGGGRGDDHLASGPAGAGIWLPLLQGIKGESRKYEEGLIDWFWNEHPLSIEDLMFISNISPMRIPLFLCNHRL